LALFAYLGRTMGSALLSEALNRARESSLSAGELLGIAGNISAAGDIPSVIELYRTWIAHHPADPIIHAIYFNYAVVLSNNNMLAEARDALYEAIRINPDFMPPYINLGNVLERMGATGDGIQEWYKAVNRLSAITGEAAGYKTTALKQIGRVLERFQLDENAEEALRLSLDINPHQSDVIQHWVSLRQRQCKWPVITPRGSLTKELLLKGISALSLAAYTDDPMLQLANAAAYSNHNIGRPVKSFSDTHQKHHQTPTSARRKIGYLSSDLREHAIGYLTSEVYELHDRTKVEVFLYYCGHEVKDQVQARIKAAADHWLDISPLSDEEAGARMIADGIEILIDLNGYTHGARTKLLSMRPAPIIVNWLGFPGSLGNPSHHYIIGDEFVTPPVSEIYYSEKVLRLPCYQPNDRKREISQRRPTRQEVGLPDDAMVFCCFNGVHKVTPFTWRRWMSILHQVPGSVLWLLDSIESTNVRLKQLAASHGIAPERIIFAPKARNCDHLARYPLADLFLDTSPYGAHTTSSDALWMGVPVLTLVGRSFASRVCGSLVRSAGIGELVCTTETEFVQMAVDLAHDKSKLMRYRQRLAAARDTCVLFDTPRLVASLEKLYAQMWADFKANRLPRPDLTNLDVYLDIGIELDQNDRDLLTVPNYTDLYQQKLAERDSFSLIRPDDRLWTGTAKATPIKIDPRPEPVHPQKPATEDPAVLLQAATIQAQAGNLDRAMEFLNRCIALDPKNAIALDLAARILVATGQTDLAEGYARRAVDQQPIIPFGLTLAEVMKGKKQFAGAISFFKSVLESQPRELRALAGLAEVYEATGQRSLAISHYESALAVDPNNGGLAIKYVALLPAHRLPQGLAALEKAAPKQDAPLKTRLNFLNQHVLYKEWGDRILHGLNAYHANSFEESHFQFASSLRDSYHAIADQILAQNSNDLDAIGAKAVSLLSLGRPLESEIFFQKIAAALPGSIYEAITFDPDFYRLIESKSEQDLTLFLPALMDVHSVSFSDKPIIFLSCSYQYYLDFARIFLLSIDDVSDNGQVHLHIMDASDEELAEIKSFCGGFKNCTIAISAERPNMTQQGLMPARCYYHAVRFIRLLQYLRKYRKPMWMMDVDALFHLNALNMFSRIKNADMAFRVRPGRWEPWNQYSAGILGVQPTEAAFRCLRLIAGYIADFHHRDRLRWGIDQMAMYGAYQYLVSVGQAPQISILDDLVLDHEYRENGIIWGNSGKDKFSQLEQVAEGYDINADPQKTSYIQLLKKYVSKLN